MVDRALSSDGSSRASRKPNLMPASNGGQAASPTHLLGAHSSAGDEDTEVENKRGSGQKLNYKHTPGPGGRTLAADGTAIPALYASSASNATQLGAPPARVLANWSVDDVLSAHGSAPSNSHPPVKKEEAASRASTVEAASSARTHTVVAEKPASAFTFERVNSNLSRAGHTSSSSSQTTSSQAGSKSSFSLLAQQREERIAQPTYHVPLMLSSAQMVSSPIAADDGQSLSQVQRHKEVQSVALQLALDGTGVASQKQRGLSRAHSGSMERGE